MWPSSIPLDPRIILEARRGRDLLVIMTQRERLSDYSEIYREEWPALLAATTEGQEVLSADYRPLSRSARLFYKLAHSRFGEGKSLVDMSGTPEQRRARNEARLDEQFRETLAIWTSFS